MQKIPAKYPKMENSKSLEDGLKTIENVIRNTKVFATNEVTSLSSDQIGLITHKWMYN